VKDFKNISIAIFHTAEFFQNSCAWNVKGGII